MATTGHGVTFELEPHHFGVRKGVRGSLCMYCGLVHANNFLTEFAVKYGCNWSDHPSAKWAVANLPKRWQERRSDSQN